MDSSRSLADSAVASTPARRWKRKSAPCVMGHVANRCPLRNHAAARAFRLCSGVASAMRRLEPSRYTLLFVIESLDVLGGHGPGATESGETVIAHLYGSAFRPFRRLQNEVANHSSEAAVLIPGDGLGEVVGLICNVKRSSHNNIMAQA